MIRPLTLHDVAGRHALATLLLVLVAGCAAQRGVELPDLSDWKSRTRILGGLDDWEFKGRIVVKSGQDGFDANIRYTRNADDYRATVRGPLGIGTVRIQGDSRGVTVTDNEGEEWILTDPEADLYVMYGWTIPVPSLRYWALGIPDPAVPAETRFSEDGLLASLSQDGWQVDIDQYREGGGQPMPRRLSAVSGDNRVRLSIYEWTFR